LAARAGPIAPRPNAVGHWAASAGGQKGHDIASYDGIRHASSAISLSHDSDVFDRKFSGFGFDAQ